MACTNFCWLNGSDDSYAVFPDVYGSKAWIRIPLGFTQVTLQPSEFVKTFMVVVLAVYVEIYARRNYKWTTVMRIPIIFLLSFILMIFIQKI